MKPNFEELIKDKIKNCYNTNSIFNTTNYITVDDCLLLLEQVYNQALSKPNINIEDSSTNCGLKCGYSLTEIVSQCEKVHGNCSQCDYYMNNNKTN